MSLTDLAHLSELEDELIELASALDRPFAFDREAMFIALIAQRTRGIYSNFIDSLRGRSPETAGILLRPMVELNITGQFVLHPDIDTPLALDLWWEAGEEDRTKAVRELDELAKTYPDAGMPYEVASFYRLQPSPEASELRQRAHASQFPGYEGKAPRSLFPTMLRQARFVGPAAQEVYSLVYRSLSGDVHGNSGSFDFNELATSIETRPYDQVQFTHAKPLVRVDAARLLGARTLISTLAVADQMLSLSIGPRLQEILIAFNDGELDEPLGPPRGPLWSSFE